MAWKKNNRQVMEIDTDRIAPNPNQPRQRFDTGTLEELSHSIALYGVLQPLTVRASGDAYELVAGERRLRAAKLAGLRRVPCLVTEAGDEESACLALIENLQREDLDYLEEACAISELIRCFGLSQEEVARRMGMTQSAVANKLRLLRLSPVCAAKLRQHGLTERHARALLRLADEEERFAALEEIIRHGWNVAQSEEYITRRITAGQTTPPEKRGTYVIKDVRLFLNSVNRSMRLMQEAGVDAACDRSDTDEEICLTIRIPKHRND